jgi:cyclophilin family peptidyl-prolyl cis-trans isomerase
VRRFVFPAALVALLFLNPQASPGQTPPPVTPAFGQLASDEELVASVRVTSATETLGVITVRLYDKTAPAHVLNFAKLAAAGFYDGTAFHRIGPESFVQGGDPLSRDADPANDGTGGPGYDLTPELGDTPFVRGTVGAASMGKRDNGSQFFICLRDHPEWDGKYTPIGVVISGLEVGDKIAAAKHKGDRPQQPLHMAVQIEKRTRKVKLY